MLSEAGTGTGSGVGVVEFCGLKIVLKPLPGEGASETGECPERWRSESRSRRGDRRARRNGGHLVDCEVAGHNKRGCKAFGHLVAPLRFEN